MILERILNIKDKWLAYSLEAIFMIYFFSFVTSWFVVFYKISALVIILSFTITIALVLLGNFLTRRYEGIASPRVILSRAVGEAKDFRVFDLYTKFCIIALPLLFLLGVYILISVQTGKYIETPWQVIPQEFIYLFLLFTVLVSFLIFFSNKTKIVLFAIILHSFLLHSYLPVVYENGFGGDRWRHIGIERKLIQGELYPPTSPISTLVSGSKTSYASKWSLSIIISKVFRIDNLHVDTFLGFILWSLFVPILLYQLGSYFIENQRFRLLLAFLPAVFYPLQVYGAMTNPAGFTFPFFLLFLIFWLHYLKYKEKPLLIFSLILLFFSFWGYIIYFLINLLVIFITFLFKIKNKALFILGLIPAILLLPLLELWKSPNAKFLPASLDFDNLINFLATNILKFWGINTHLSKIPHLEEGNYVYHQLAKNLSSASFFSLTALDSILFIILIFLIIYSLLAFLKGVVKLTSILLVVLLSSVFISWYFFGGVHLLVERLDLVISLLLLILLGGAIYELVLKREVITSSQKKNYLILAFVFTAFISIISASTYTSGPRSGMVTSDHLAASKYIWSEMQKRGEEDFCVLAEHWPLLALEAVSSGKIINGNFPILYNYYDPERGRLFIQMFSNPRVEILEEAQLLTKARGCYYIPEKKFIIPPSFKKTKEILGEPKVFGEVYVWRYEH